MAEDNKTPAVNKESAQSAPGPSPMKMVYAGPPAPGGARGALNFGAIKRLFQGDTPAKKGPRPAAPMMCVYAGPPSSRVPLAKDDNDVSPKAAPTVLRCPGCGTYLSSPDKFCPACGAELKNNT